MYPCTCENRKKRHELNVSMVEHRTVKEGRKDNACFILVCCTLSVGENNGLRFWIFLVCILHICEHRYLLKSKVFNYSVLINVKNGGNCNIGLCISQKENLKIVT